MFQVFFLNVQHVLKIRTAGSGTGRSRIQDSEHFVKVRTNGLVRTGRSGIEDGEHVVEIGREARDAGREHQEERERLVQVGEEQQQVV